MSWTTRIAGGIGVCAAALTADHLRFQSLQKEACRAVEANKLSVRNSSSDHHTLLVKSLYGSPTVKPGAVIATVTLERKASWLGSRVRNVECDPDHFPTTTPILRYLDASSLVSLLITRDIVDSRDEPLERAERKWMKEEIKQGDLGFFRDMKATPIRKEDEEKVAYYTQVALLTLGFGLSLPDLYESGFDPANRIKSNGAIGLCHHGVMYGDGTLSGNRFAYAINSFITPLGESSSPWFGTNGAMPPNGPPHPIVERVSICFRDYGNIGTVSLQKIFDHVSHESFNRETASHPFVEVNSEGQVLPRPVAEDRPSDYKDPATFKLLVEQGQQEWSRLRDPVFRRVNECLRKKPPVA